MFKLVGRAMAAASAILLLASGAMAGAATAAEAPVNTALPVISGTARDGSTLTASTGSWSGTQPLSYAYQWRRCDAYGNGCVDVGAASAATYELVASDIGSRLRVAVTASNDAGGSTAVSAPTATIVAAAPLNTARPSISGTSRQGEILSGSAGSWTGTLPITFRYVWKRCDSAASNCVTIEGADEADYMLDMADVGHTLRLRVYATNVAGTRTSYTTATTIVAPPCPIFADASRAGTVSLAAASELSGLVASRRNPGVLWTHNDSGDTERVFALDTRATYLGTYRVSSGSQADWEDIAAGPGPVAGVSYLYIGSIGGNGGRHSIYVYRTPEPAVSPGQAPVDVTFSSVEKLRMEYPGTEAYNAESLMVDPLTGDIYVATKGYSGSTRVFRYPAAAQDPSTTYTLQRVKTLLLPGAATAGDFSPDGTELVIKGYDWARLWQRPRGVSVGAGLAVAPCAITPTPGEALGYALDGSGYFTVAEGSFQPLYWIARLTG